MLTRKQLQEALWVAAQAHESLLRQKARSRWIKEGDCNSLYFHLLMNANRGNNSLKGVMIDGTWTDEPHRVKEEVRSFFSQRFQEPDYHRPRLAVGEHQIEEELPKELQAEEQGIQPEQVLVTRMFGSAGAKIPQVFIKWKGQHAEGATLQDRSNMMQQFPAFNLEDKVLFLGGYC